MVIELRTPDENEAERRRRFLDGENGFRDDADDDELEFFGIFVKKQGTPTCPYDKNGEYVPRSQRR